MNPLFSQLFPQGLFVIPPTIIPPQFDPIQQREEVQTPPPRPHADRWHTPVCVEVIINGNIRRIKWFSDLQMAWIYVHKIVFQTPNEDWVIKSFERTARTMDVRWQDGRGDLGYVIAKCKDVKFRAFYDPEEDSPSSLPQ